MKRGTLHHVEVNVTDLQRSLTFWDWFLVLMGYSLLQKWDKGQSYKLGDTYLVFVQTEERFIKEGYHRKRTGLNHLAFFADTRAQVDKLTEQLKQRSIPVLYEDKHPFAGGPDHYAVYFEDPDRIKVEVTVSE